MMDIFADVATGLFCIAAITFIVWLYRGTKKMEQEADRVLAVSENVAGTGNGFSEAVPPPNWRTTVYLLAEWAHALFMLSMAILFITLSACLISAVVFAVVVFAGYFNQGVLL